MHEILEEIKEPITQSKLLLSITIIIGTQQTEVSWLLQNPISKTQKIVVSKKGDSGESTCQNFNPEFSQNENTGWLPKKFYILFSVHNHGDVFKFHEHMCVRVC